MRTATSRPTLLVFTLGPRREGQRRRLLPGRCGHLEREIHRRGLAEALDAGRRRGARLVVSTPRPLELPPDVEQVPQRGRGFGRRLAGAIRACGARPGEPLLVVGTDTPGLAPEHLERSLERLSADPSAVVIGPSPDGGLYLLGFAAALDRQLARVRWCRRDTLRSLLAALAGSGRSAVLLPPLRDLDRRADLERWLAGRGHHAAGWRLLGHRLAELLAALRRPPLPDAVPAIRPALVPAAVERGPPA